LGFGDPAIGLEDNKCDPRAEGRLEVYLADEADGYPLEYNPEAPREERDV
jgi:hypothetical protein